MIDAVPRGLVASFLYCVQLFARRATFSELVHSLHSLCLRVRAERASATRRVPSVVAFKHRLGFPLAHFTYHSATATRPDGIDPYDQKACKS